MLGQWHLPWIDPYYYPPVTSRAAKIIHPSPRLRGEGTGVRGYFLRCASRPPRQVFNAIRSRTLLPFPLPGQSFVEVDSRRPAEMAPQLVGVGEGMALIARPRILLEDRRRITRNGFQLLDDFPHRGGFAATDIVHFTRRRLDRSERSGDTIRDKRVASNLLAVAVDDDRFPLQQCLDETMIAHVRPLTRAIYGKVAERHDRNSRRFGIRPAQMLAGQLGYAIRRNGPRRQRFISSAEFPVHR